MATPLGTYDPGPKVCEVGGKALLLPLWGDDENRWPPGLRVTLYGLGMVYFFVGVAIIADAFVASIERVTGRRCQHRTSDGRLHTQKVWNDTVATLSLMALGSSAPEIALSVLDLFKKSFHFTPLGAQTIAGSAAFNLLVIVGVCIIVIPSPEIRLIQELPAFYVTAGVSVFAYFWLAFILIVRTQDVIEIWEAALTFLFLPVLIWLSYKVDVGDAGRLLARLTSRSGGVPEELENPDKPECVIGLPSGELTVDAGDQESKTVDVIVRRSGDCSGQVVVCFHTLPLTATPGYEYTAARGKLDFGDGVSEQTIHLEVLPRHPNRIDRKLLLFLEDVQGGASFDQETDGGEDADIMTVTIKAPGESSGGGMRCLDSVVSISGLRRGMADWVEQIRCSVYCLGSYEEQQEATALDWVGHLVSLPWKLLFSLLPPTSFFGGWACFYTSLAGIGGLTIFVSDLAELFGCVIGIGDDVTAIVFVALGTSMPDLFASLSAAREEPTADASIVNVTGSNSVNVFLGLGLPWTIGAIYWAVVGQTEEWKQRYPKLAQEAGPNGGASFVVESRNLGFCVLIFGTACAAALLILHLRRKCLGAELGGPFVPKVACFCAFIVFWLGFISVSSWRVDRWERATTAEAWLVIMGVGAFELVVTIVTVVIIVMYRHWNEVREDVASDADKRLSKSQFRRSQSMGSVTSTSSRNSRNKELPKGTSNSSLSEGNTNLSSLRGVGFHVMKPRLVSSVNELSV